MTPVNPRVLGTLDIGISSEVKSYVFYLEAAKVIAQEKFKATLLKLAGEEKEHYHILERQHHALVTSEQWVSYNDILKRPGLPEINEQMTSVHGVLLASVRAARDQREILEIALGLERDAHALFAEAASKAVDPEERKTFDYLAKFEMGHIRLIQGMIDSL